MAPQRQPCLDSMVGQHPQPAAWLQGKMEALVAQLLVLPAAVATINVGDKDGLTPLHWAATEGTSS